MLVYCCLSEVYLCYDKYQGYTMWNLNKRQIIKHIDSIPSATKSPHDLRIVLPLLSLFSIAHETRSSYLLLVTNDCNKNILGFVV